LIRADDIYRASRLGFGDERGGTSSGDSRKLMYCALAARQKEFRCLDRQLVCDADSMA
jgi:hypothetical protein